MLSPNQPHNLFVTGIGTGVGKTLVTAALAYQWQQHGDRCRALKPVVTGCDMPDPLSDTAILAAVTGQTPDEISPWRFTAPLSPHLAAAQESRPIEYHALLTWCRTQLHEPGVTLIEGVGGLMVPLNDDKLVIDWMMDLALPAVLVGSSYLGAINHTLLSVRALEQAGIPLCAVIVSQADMHDAGLAGTVASLRARIDAAVPVVVLPRLPCADRNWKIAPDLLSVIYGL